MSTRTDTYHGPNVPQITLHKSVVGTSPCSKIQIITVILNKHSNYVKTYTNSVSEQHSGITTTDNLMSSVYIQQEQHTQRRS